MTTRSLATLMGLLIIYPGFVVFLFRYSRILNPGLVAGVGFVLLTGYVIWFFLNSKLLWNSYGLWGAVVFFCCSVFPIMYSRLIWGLGKGGISTEQKFLGFSLQGIHDNSSRFYTLMVLAVAYDIYRIIKPKEELKGDPYEHQPSRARAKLIEKSDGDPHRLISRRFDQKPDPNKKGTDSKN